MNPPRISRVSIERRGGFAGLKARGELDMAALPAGERQALESLLARPQPLPAAPGADRYTYRLRCTTVDGVLVCDVPEHLAPPCVVAAVKEQI